MLRKVAFNMASILHCVIIGVLRYFFWAGIKKGMFIDNNYRVEIARMKQKNIKLFSLLISSYIFQFPGRPLPPLWFLCPWHPVRVALSQPSPLLPSALLLLSILAPSVSCHVRLSWSRRGSRVSKRTVNFPGWRW